MKLRNYFLSGLLLACVTTTATAQESPLYISGKIGLMDADLGGFDDAMNLGVTVGYDLYTHPMGIFSVEGEYTTTFSDGEISGGGEWDADTLAAFGVFRTPGDMYFKGKVGYLGQDIKRAGGAGGTIPNADDSDFAFGVGGGWKMDRASSFELEYTVASDELTFISVGYVRRF